MTIVRDQIHCLVPKNDAVMIVIEDDCDATTIQSRRGLRTLITSNVIQIKIHLPAVRRHMSVNHFLSIVLQCHVVRCHCLDICRTHHRELRCKPGRTDMSKTSRIDHQLVLLGLAIGLIFPVHRVQVSSTCLLLSLSLISVTLDFDFRSSACTNNQMLCVSTVRSFDTHPRSASALLSFHRNLCLSGFLFLSFHPSCPSRIFLCLSFFGSSIGYSSCVSL